MLPVELLGLPGAGKSFVYSKATAQGLTGRNSWRDNLRLPGFTSATQVLVKSVRLAATLMLGVLASRGPRRGPLSMVGSVVRRHQILNSIPLDEGPQVIDEGPLHALFVMLYGTQMTWLSRRLLSSAARQLCAAPRMFVLIDVPPQECMTNWAGPNRASVRFNSQTSENERRAFSSDQTYALIRAELEVSAGDRLHVVDDVDMAIELLIEWARTARCCGPNHR